MTFRFADLVGTYRLVISNELLAFIERAFVDVAPLADRAAIRADALSEAEGAELEICSNGTIVSRSRGQEFYRVVLAVDAVEHETITFEKAPGHPVALSMTAGGAIIAVQPGKPAAEFRRL